MKMYYVLFVDQFRFTGYTDNQYIWNKYIQQFPKDIEIKPDSVETKSEKHFLEAFNRFINHNLDIPYLFNSDLKLFSINDSNNGDIIVVNKLLYNSFIQDFTSSREMSKILNEFYRHFSHYGEDVNKYILGDTGELINNITSIVFKNYYSKLRLFKDLDEYETYMGLSYRESCELWETLNECFELKRYFKNTLLLYSMKRHVRQATKFSYSDISSGQIPHNCFDFSKMYGI